MSNSEIHKKLKVAIGRRLRELEVYVDDELPDYVMVMVANRKDKRAMKNDLDLFLGGNTDAFVDWLFDVIERLQNARVSSPLKDEKKKTRDGDREKEGEREKEKRRKDDEKKEKERSRKEVESHSHHYSKSHHKTSEHSDHERKREKERHKEEEKGKIDRKKSDFPKEKESSGLVERREKERKERDRKVREREEEEKRVRREDEEKRARKEEEEKRVRKEEEEKRARKEEEEKRARKEEEEKRARKEEEERVRRREEASQKRAREREREQERKRRERSNTWSDDENDLQRRALSSVSVRRDVPPHPTLSSQVTVKRKVPISRGPHEKHGISSLLKRAINDANLSAAAGYGAPVQKKALQQKQGLKKIILPDTMIVDTAPSIDNNEMKFTITMKNVPRAALKRKQEQVAKRDPSPVEVKGKRVRARITAPSSQHKESEDDEDMIDKVVEQTIVNKSQARNPSPIVWDGQINLGESEMSEEDDEAEIDAVLASTQKIVRPSVVEEDVLPPTHQLSRGDSYHSSYSPMNNSPVLQYIPTPISKPISTDEPVVISAPVSLSPLGNTKVNEKCRFWPNCVRDDATCPYVHPTKQCMAFPSCGFGNHCLYIHPPCRYNTRCQNPTCHFTHSGTNLFPASCAALATVVRVPAPLTISTPSTTVPKSTTLPAPSAPGQAKVGASVEKGPEIPISMDLPTQPTIPCRFKGQCKKTNCPFKHPATCRFGDQCLNPQCFFYHPQKPKITVAKKTPGKYKWQATTQTSA